METETTETEGADEEAAGRGEARSVQTDGVVGDGEVYDSRAPPVDEPIDPESEDGERWPMARSLTAGVLLGTLTAALLPVSSLETGIGVLALAGIVAGAVRGDGADGGATAGAATTPPALLAAIVGTPGVGWLLADPEAFLILALVYGPVIAAFGLVPGWVGGYLGTRLSVGSPAP